MLLAKKFKSDLHNHKTPCLQIDGNKQTQLKNNQTGGTTCSSPSITSDQMGAEEE